MYWEFSMHFFSKHAFSKVQLKRSTLNLCWNSNQLVKAFTLRVDTWPQVKLIGFSHLCNFYSNSGTFVYLLYACEGCVWSSALRPRENWSSKRRNMEKEAERFTDKISYGSWEREREMERTYAWELKLAAIPGSGPTWGLKINLRATQGPSSSCPFFAFTWGNFLFVFKIVCKQKNKQRTDAQIKEKRGVFLLDSKPGIKLTKPLKVN